jgi:hypothetical protein
LYEHFVSRESRTHLPLAAVNLPVKSSLLLQFLSDKCINEKEMGSHPLGQKWVHLDLLGITYSENAEAWLDLQYREPLLTRISLIPAKCRPPPPLVLLRAKRSVSLLKNPTS